MRNYLNLAPFVPGLAWPRPWPCGAKKWPGKNRIYNLKFLDKNDIL